MSDEINKQKGALLIVISSILLGIVTVFSIITQLWVLIAIPVGFLFGFFLQKGDLCGSSAFSEVLLFKDKSKVFGLWIAIITSMAGLALLDIGGLIQLNPKPMFWVNSIVGGIIFGVGMVLAGGCVSGCLYKTGTGNINSMAGLVGIPIGVALVEYGPLNGIFLTMKSMVFNTSDGNKVTLSTLTGLPFWVLVVLFIIATLVLVHFNKGRTNTHSKVKKGEEKFGFLFRAWKPWAAGIGIGILVIPAYLSSVESGRNYPLGVTHGVLHLQTLAMEKNLEHVYQKPTVSLGTQNQLDAKQLQTPKPKGKKVSWWLILLVTSLIAGSWISARIAGKAKLLPKPPEQTFVAFFGGILVGIGAAFATGCVIGNIVSGWALMSVGSLIFGIVTIISNWVTTYLYLMDGNLKPTKNK